MVSGTDLGGKEQSPEAKGQLVTLLSYQTGACNDMGAWERRSGDGYWRYLAWGSHSLRRGPLDPMIDWGKGRKRGENINPILDT